MLIKTGERLFDVIWNGSNGCGCSKYLFPNDEVCPYPPHEKRGRVIHNILHS